MELSKLFKWNNKEIEVDVNCLDEGVISKSKSNGKYLLENIC